MLNYLKSEFYRLFRNKGYYIFGGIFSGLIIFASVMLYAFNREGFPYATEAFLYGNILAFMPVAFVFTYSIIQFVVSDEMKEGTLKNTVAYGISRDNIYFGKLFVEIAALLLVAVVTVLVSLASGRLLLSPVDAHRGWYLKGVFASAPLILAAVTTFHALALWSESQSRIMGFYLLVYLLPVVICYYMGGRFEWAGWIMKHCPFYQISRVTNEFTTQKIIEYWISGMAYTAVFIGIGYALFQKKEIK